MADTYIKELFRKKKGQPLCLKLFQFESLNQAELLPWSFTITCLNHMTKTKAHYLVIDFSIRDIKVFKKLT